MKRFRWLLVLLLCVPLASNVGAEVISWLLPTTYVDNTAIQPADQARIKVYLRGWKAGKPGAKTYFGEGSRGGTSWGQTGDNTYIMKQMNTWAKIGNVAGWDNVVPGDTIYVTASSAITWAVDNVMDLREFDGPESPPTVHTIYKVPPPPPPTPSCQSPSGVTIKP